MEPGRLEETSLLERRKGRLAAGILTRKVGLKSSGLLEKRERWDFQFLRLTYNCPTLRLLEILVPRLPLWGKNEWYRVL